MAERVPTCPLDVVAQAVPRLDAAPLDVFMLGQRVEGLQATFGTPYRSQYYGVGICLHGTARITADLHSHEIRPRTVLAMPPQTIKRWQYMSDDFEHIAIFFTQAYITERTQFDPADRRCRNADDAGGRVAV